MRRVAAMSKQDNLTVRMRVPKLAEINMMDYSIKETQSYPHQICLNL